MRIRLLTFLLILGFIRVNAESRFELTYTADDQRITEPARGVIKRLIGPRADDIKLAVIPSASGYDTFEIEAASNTLTIKGNSPVAICSGFYTYLKKGCNGMVSWSGNHIPDLSVWPDYKKERVTSPYQYRYFLNVVTYGYTMPYWTWERWQKEIDWMALHGINMPLALVAHEAIALRVWQKLGLKKDDVNRFFTGPAYLPWHRMGNINSWSGPLTDAWHNDQLKLEHQILNRMKELDFSPIVPAFAGFVPLEFREKYPDVKLSELSWGGFPKENHAFVLSPDSPWFKKIGQLFIQEWEKEFGKCKFYLSDTFNEMDVPVPANNPAKKYEILAGYGKSVYESIKAGNPDAVWVTQGWTFGWMHKFWDKPSLKAMLGAIPNDKMMIIDLACEYPDYVWHINPVWQTHEGFYGKDWVYSFVPNFGGKTALTGVLKFYAENPAKALASPYRKTLKGFGSAPEGIENNEVVYELLSDLGWTDKAIDIDSWINNYALCRYGNVPANMKTSWTELLQSCYNTFGSYPRFVWQTMAEDTRRKGKINDDPKFLDAVKQFLSCADSLKNNALYRNDAIQLSAMFLGIKADEFYRVALMADKNNDEVLKKASFEKSVYLLQQVDRLLASHPLDRLEPWVTYARAHGQNTAQKNTYEVDAKRLITIWGGQVEDYAARVWSGLISDYYIPRMQHYLYGDRATLNQWKENWIEKPYTNNVKPFDDPLQEAARLVNQYALPVAQ
ncbi:alpha-N-acetylglucosaminidase [Pedobacter sp. BS3]|uniref:alpha-N-acetylglucosaminidase n=1 Tax=Pedobacter sp. BS3 TaxID=2567937 RepID=UPI0011ECFA61|nr:alpha-N-acetylglucosaminidase [Pedobacter sp. BS3]TZF83168.1 alpha-N-acetylglucosaminidase [Pedobacter sp. BS3]